MANVWCHWDSVLEALGPHLLFYVSGTQSHTYRKIRSKGITSSPTTWTLDALYLRRRRREEKAFLMNPSGEAVTGDSVATHLSGSLLFYKMSACRSSLKAEFHEGHAHGAISLKQPLRRGKPSTLTKRGLE